MSRGYLFRFHFPTHARPTLDALLREAPYFSDYDPDYHLYNFRSRPPVQLPQMPDLYAAIEHEGVYVYEFGGEFEVIEAILNYLETSVKARFGEVTIDDLE